MHLNQQENTNWVVVEIASASGCNNIIKRKRGTPTGFQVLEIGLLGPMTRAVVHKTSCYLNLG